MEKQAGKNATFVALARRNPIFCETGETRSGDDLHQHRLMVGFDILNCANQSGESITRNQAQNSQDKTALDSQLHQTGVKAIRDDNSARQVSHIMEEEDASRRRPKRWPRGCKRSHGGAGL